MTRLPARPAPALITGARPARPDPRAPAGAAALALMVLMVLPAAALAAQTPPGTFTLPEPTPTPTPAPAGPDDERAGVAIPPRAQPGTQPAPLPQTVATPVIQPLPDAAAAGETPAPRPASAPAATPPATGDAAAATGAELPPLADPLADDTAPPLAGTPPAGPDAQPGFGTSLTPETPLVGASVLPEWWPFAAGGAGALALLGAGLLAWRRRPRVLRLPAPAAATAADGTPLDDNPRIDLTLEITSATRSLMMFTIGWRLTIANRSDRAINDLTVAMQLACARASADAAKGGANAPSPGAAQGLGALARIGPQQARSLTGTMQLPLSAVQPLRQGAVPLFVPLAHATLEGDGLRATTRSFVIGTPSASGRVHPILLDQPPGGISGLVAQAIAVPPVSAAA